MLHLPKKRPWLYLVIAYAIIISVWVTYIIVAGKSNAKHMTPAEAEQYIKDHPLDLNTPQQAPPTK